MIDSVFKISGNYYLLELLEECKYANKLVKACSDGKTKISSDESDAPDEYIAENDVN